MAIKRGIPTTHNFGKDDIFYSKQFLKEKIVQHMAWKGTQHNEGKHYLKHRFVMHAIFDFVLVVKAAMNVRIMQSIFA